LSPARAPSRIPGVSPQALRALRWFYRCATWISPELAAQLALALFITPARRAPDATDRAILATATRRRIPFGHGYLRVFEWGDSQGAVLLAHGWSSRAARLSSFVEPLLRHGFRVVAFDAPGHGESSGVCSNVLRYRDAMQVVIQQRAPISAIIAHSLGARAALLSLATFSCEVQAACLISVPPDVRYMFEQFKLVLELRADVSRLLQQKLEKVLQGPQDG
jgi:pimeloyl-ACP methyl ester carboxylesterase